MSQNGIKDKSSRSKKVIHTNPFHDDDDNEVKRINTVHPSQSPPNYPPPPPPSFPPPSPPPSPPQLPFCPSIGSDPPFVAESDTDSSLPIKIPQLKNVLRHLSDSATNNAKNNFGGKATKKKRKKGKRRKSRTSHNTKNNGFSTSNASSSSGRSSYRQHYNAIAEDSAGGRTPCGYYQEPNIVNYSSEQQSSNNNQFTTLPSWLLRSHNSNDSNGYLSSSTTSMNGKNNTIEVDHGEEQDDKLSRGRWQSHSSRPITSPINTGELNSAEGPGTTIEELQFRIRMLHIGISVLVYLFTGFAFLGDLLTLKIPELILTIYLVFFTTILCCFEFARGVSTSTITTIESTPFSGLSTKAKKTLSMLHGGGANHFTQHNTFLTPMQRSIQLFLKDNFGILYSCVGRGICLIVAGGLALGQGFMIMHFIGELFIFLGLWTISLKFRFPTLDMTYENDLVRSIVVQDSGSKSFGFGFGTGGDESTHACNSEGGSIATWTSLHESQRLLP